VAVDDVFASQAQDQVTGGSRNVRHPPPQIRLVLPHPQNLGSDRLAGEGHAGEIVDGLLAPPLIECIHLAMRTGVHTVQYAGAQGAIVGIKRQHTRADGAQGHGTHVCAAVRITVQKLTADPDHISPPDRVSILLSPARMRDGHLMLDHDRLQQRAVRGDQHSLAGVRPDVNAQEQTTHGAAPLTPWR